jgi:hypothetical protein
MRTGELGVRAMTLEQQDRRGPGILGLAHLVGVVLLVACRDPSGELSDDGSSDRTETSSGDATSSDDTMQADMTGAEDNTDDSAEGTGSDGCPPKVLDGDATHVDPEFLTGYTVVTGRIRIDSSSATTLAGMECLEAAGGLTLWENPELVSLDGLEDLAQLTDFGLGISGNLKLVDIRALRTLARFGPRVSIRRNPKLVSLEGLEGITEISMDDLDIVDNDALIDLHGLDQLTSVASRVTIRGNASLETLAGVEKLASVNLLTLEDNPSLRALDGLEGAQSIAVRLRIAGNTVLEDVSALHGATVSSSSIIEIVENPMLPQCEAEALAEALKPSGWMGMQDVRDNLGDCP